MHNLILLASMAVSLASANPETTFVLRPRGTSHSFNEGKIYELQRD